MTNKREIVEEKLSFLYEKLEELKEVSPAEHQVSFLLNEIDYYRAELLKMEVREYYEIIENEDD
jgi:hypothetical protein